MSADLQMAAAAADAAGKIIRNGYSQLHKMEAKGVGDFVSDIDRQADQAAQQILSTDPKNTPVLSEEISPILDPGETNFWIVDPLDGTSAFLFRTGRTYSSVLVAKRQNNKTDLGVIFFPMTEEWFYAERGQGAFRNEESLVIHEPGELKTGWVELNQYGDSAFESDFFGTLRNRLRTQNGAALVTQSAPYSGVAMRIAESNNSLVAAIHDNNPESVKQAAWDIAAPQCVLSEAGGLFINRDGNPIDPFQPEPFIVARSQKIADQILQLMH